MTSSPSSFSDTMFIKLYNSSSFSAGKKVGRELSLWNPKNLQNWGETGIDTRKLIKIQLDQTKLKFGGRRSVNTSKSLKNIPNKKRK